MILLVQREEVFFWLVVLAACVDDRRVVDIEAAVLGILLVLLKDCGVVFAIIAVHAGVGVIMEQEITVAEVVDAGDIAVCAGDAACIEQILQNLVIGTAEEALVGAVIQVVGWISFMGEANGAGAVVVGTVGAVVGESQPLFGDAFVCIDFPGFAVQTVLLETKAGDIDELRIVEEMDVDKVAGIGNAGKEATGVSIPIVIACSDPIAVEDIIQFGIQFG